MISNVVILERELRSEIRTRGILQSRRRGHTFDGGDEARFEEVGHDRLGVERMLSREAKKFVASRNPGIRSESR